MDLKNCILQKLFYPKNNDIEKDSSIFIIGEFTSHNTRKIFTGKGQIINPEIDGEYILLNGKWEENHYNGTIKEQFNFNYAKKDMPSDIQGIFRYIMKQPNIGQSIANNIIDKYGIDSIDIMKNHPGKLAANIKGITPARAKIIAKDLKKNDDMESIHIELESIIGDVKGLPKKTIPELINRHNLEAPDLIKQNPYILTDIKGIGFLLADRVAIEKIQIKPDSVFRQAAAIEHCLKESQMSGHVWAFKETILQNTSGLIGYSACEGMTDLIYNKIIVLKVVDNIEYITTKSENDNELIIANRINQLI